MVPLHSTTCAKTSKVRGKELEELARNCRNDIDHKWFDDISCGRGSNEWREELAKMLVCHTVFRQRKGWQEVLKSGAEKLKAEYPDKSNVIEKIKNGYLKKCPVEGFLKAKAYQWLQYLKAHPPKDSAWYPHLAVEVAHKVFRMKGKLKTFQKYLKQGIRKRLLKSIRLSGEGRSSHVRSMRSH